MMAGTYYAFIFLHTFSAFSHTLVLYEQLLHKPSSLKQNKIDLSVSCYENFQLHLLTLTEASLGYLCMEPASVTRKVDVLSVDHPNYSADLYVLEVFTVYYL